MSLKYNVNWTNDVGDYDEYYHEYWEVWEGPVNGPNSRKICECNVENDAHTIARLLNKESGS